MSSFEFHIDPKLNDFLKEVENERLLEARKNAVIAMGMVWADQAKSITRIDKHIITSLYINSIGYVTGSPAKSEDVIHEVTVEQGRTTLTIGSNVAYAAVLEKRYNIFARALDMATPRMQAVAQTQIERTLFG